MGFQKACKQKDAVSQAYEPITWDTTSSFKFSPSVFLNNVPGNGSEELASKLLRNLNFYFFVFNLNFLFFCVFVLFLCKILFIKSRSVYRNPCLKKLARYHGFRSSLILIKILLLRLSRYRLHAK